MLNKIATSEEHFDERLKNIFNAFVEWRYFYEYEECDLKLDFDFLKIFSYCLKQLKILYE